MLENTKELFSEVTMRMYFAMVAQIAFGAGAAMSSHVEWLWPGMALAIAVLMAAEIGVIGCDDCPNWWKVALAVVAVVGGGIMAMGLLMVGDCISTNCDQLGWVLETHPIQFGVGVLFVGGFSVVLTLANGVAAIGVQLRLAQKI